MKNNIKLSNIVAILFSVFFMISCGSSDDESTDISITTEIKIEEAKLTGFKLFGIENKTIEIIAPEIAENKEVKYGEIKLTVPANTSLDNVSISITSKELNLNKFKVSPANDTKLSFENQKVHVLTISLIENDIALLHYNVTVIKEEEPVPATLKITGFTFEKNKNPNLPNDITISRTITDTGLDKIYLFVPLRTDFTNLIPTITYDGAKLYYTQDTSIAPANINVEYPSEGKRIDFKYPKHFIVVVKDEDNDRLKATDVIVDVVNPVKIETALVTTPDAKKGAIRFFKGVTKWVNQGNHPIRFAKATTYENEIPENTEAITARMVLPGGVGLLPGESADINLSINALNYPEDITYKRTAIFYSRIHGHQGVDDLLESIKLTITSKIIK